MSISELIPNVNLLRFPAELEKAFHDDYYQKSIVTTRLALVLVLGMGLVALFSLLDFWAAPLAWPLIWQIRFLFICPPALCVGRSRSSAWPCWAAGWASPP
jgi:hypothetical protein